MRIGKLLAATTVVVLTVATVAVAQLPPGGTFEDDNGSIHEADIEAIAAAGITRGCNPPTNDRFCPTDPVTRGQMAAFLVRALGLPGGGDTEFIDIAGSVFAADIEALAAAGITRGCNPPTNDRFCPTDPVTRGQMAAFLVRAMGYTDDGGGDLFVDDDTSVFASDIDRLGTAGVTFGCNPPANDRFCPTAQVTRGQMASFLTRALELTPITPPSSTTTLPSGNFCTGSLGDATIDDDLIVPTGATCTLEGTVVEGNVIVRTGATLVASGVSVDGNIQSDGHTSVSVTESSFVGGNVQSENGGTATVDTSEVDGNIQMESNSGKLTITDNVVGGDIQVNSNTGGAVISANTVDGNLQCQSNNPAPTGGNNTVEGDKEDQCEGL